MKFDNYRIVSQVRISVTTEVQYCIATGWAQMKLGLPWFEHSLAKSSIIMNACYSLFQGNCLAMAHCCSNCFMHKNNNCS